MATYLLVDDDGNYFSAKAINIEDAIKQGIAFWGFKDSKLIVSVQLIGH